MNKQQLQFYQEKAKVKGKLLLIEECNSIITAKNIEILKEGKLIESAGKQYEALAVVRNCPVSKYTENKNKRIYNKSLWETVKNNGVYESTYSLADHPIEEGSVKDTWGVWHNLHLTEEGAFSDLYLIEEKPVRILKAGGSLGISSVGYGEFMEDGKTVNAESYELERLGDIVLNPSQGTFATFENIQEDLQKNKEKDNSFLKEITNNKIEIIEKNSNNLGGAFKMTKLDILNTKNNIKSTLKSIKESVNYKESLDELEELYIDIPEELPNYKSKVAEAISQLKERMEEEIKNTSLTLGETKDKFEELKTKYETVNSALSEMTEKYKKAETIINKVGINEKSSFTSKDIEIMKENMKSMKSDIEQMYKDRKNMKYDLSCYEEDSIAMRDDIKIFKEERKIHTDKMRKLSEQLRIAETYIKKYEKMLEDNGYEFDDEDEDEEKIDAEDISENSIVTDNGQIIVPIIEAEIDDNITATNSSNSDVNYDEDKEAEGGVETPINTQVAPTFKEEDETDVCKDLEDNDEITEEEESDVGKDKEEMEESYVFKYSSRNDRPKEKIVKNVSNKSNKKIQVIKTTQKILEFYNEIANDKPYIKNFAKEILGSKTLTEAVDKVSSLRKNSNNDMIRVQESVSKRNDDTIEYKFNY